MARRLYTAGLLALVLWMTAGCQNEQTMSGSGRMRPRNQKKIGLLTDLDKKYDNPEAHYNLGRLYYLDGMYDRARFHYDVALKFNPVHYRAMAGMVKTLRQEGKTLEAKEKSRAYIAQASESVQRLVRLGDAFMKHELPELAIDCYQQVLRMEPESAVAYKKIGMYHLEKDQKVKAEEYLRRSFEIDPYQADVAGELGKMGIVVEIPRT